jgi:hypothetical protein
MRSAAATNWVNLVLGSFTAGEIARNATSTIWMMPNYTPCRSVRVGPMSNAPNSAAARAGQRNDERPDQEAPRRP